MPKAIAELSADAAILISHCSELPKGTNVTYEEIAKLIGWDVRTNRNVMGTVKRRLCRDYGRVLGSVMRIGYRVLTDEEVATGELSRDRRHRRRHATRSKAKAGTVAIAELNEAHQVQLLSEVSAAHVAAEASRDNAVKRIADKINGSTQPLALNFALEAVKKNLEK